MNHLWNIVTRTALPKMGASGSVSERGGGVEEENHKHTHTHTNNQNQKRNHTDNIAGDKRRDKDKSCNSSNNDTTESKNNSAQAASPKEKTMEDACPGNTNGGGDDDSSCLSSLSFYEDFPTLYFAVRKGRCTNNSVFLSWDSAREHIVDYPDAEYIATPTLEQAHRYTNGIGEFDKNIGDDREDSTSSEQEVETSPPSQAESESSEELLPPAVLPEKQAKATATLSRAKGKVDKPKLAKTKYYTTRKLLFEYYECYDPGYKAKGQKPLTIPKFLKQRDMFKSKFKVFAKHWQRSGLLMMCNEEKPLEEAISKYNGWVRDRKLEKLGINPEDIIDRRTKIDNRKSHKRKRPVVLLSSNGNSNSNAGLEESPASNIPNKSKSKNRNKWPPTKRRKRKSSPGKPTARNEAESNLGAPSPPLDAALLQHATIVTAKPLHTSRDNSEDEDDDNDEQFNAMYEKLKEFHSKHGHCNVTNRDGHELRRFVSYTKRRMRAEKRRSGARGLTLREEKLLNDLDFDPEYKEIVTEFNKYLGMRVAKLFDVLVGGDVEDDSVVSSPVPLQKGIPRIKKVPFFGTVGRISSVCNRVRRVFVLFVLCCFVLFCFVLLDCFGR